MKLKILKYLLLSSFLLLNYSAFSQIYCTATANCTDGDYIDRFTFSTIANLNSGGSNCGGVVDSYIFTGLKDTVFIGGTYNFSVQGGPDWDQCFGIWIDYNRNASFNESNEFVFSNTSATKNVINGSITIPLNATPGLTRMRVRSQFQNPLTAQNACGAIAYGEIEDYELYILSNPIPPQADFTVSSTVSCGGIQFTDASKNMPNAWNWNFGDGNTSTQRNPYHTYSANGTYTVRLIASNTFGTDTITRVNYIQINSAPSLVSTCTVSSLNNPSISGTGILSLSFAGINNTSGDALSSGYENNTCIATNVQAGIDYQFSINCGSVINHNVRAWIDFNNDGNLTANELIISADNISSYSQTVKLPSQVALNTPLRLRVSADSYLQAAPTSCSNSVNGQTEDYTLIFTANTNPPIAAFTANRTVSCNGEVSFIDASQNLPTTWLWNFGDGNASAQPNPTHSYQQSGTYTVSLIVSNSNGSDTLTATNYINVNFDKDVKAACTPNTLNHFADYGIYKVELNTLSHISAGAQEGYKDYSCTRNTELVAGKSYNISIQTGTQNDEDVRVWIDFNNNGTFENAELVYTSLSNKNHSGTIQIPITSVKNTMLRMRVYADIIGNFNDVCQSPLASQIEDYGLLVKEATIAANFTADSTKSCKGLVKFTSQSVGNPTSFAWNFGDGNTSTFQNPTHQYALPGEYTVRLIVNNGSLSDTLVLINYIKVGPQHCLTDIEELELNKLQVQIYPNPANHFFSLRSTHSGMYTLQLINTLGQIQLSKSVTLESETPYNIETSSFSDGLYIITIQNEQGSSVQKLLIKH